MKTENLNLNEEFNLKQIEELKRHTAILSEIEKNQKQIIQLLSPPKVEPEKKQRPFENSEYFEEMKYIVDEIEHGIPGEWMTTEEVRKKLELNSFDVPKVILGKFLNHYFSKGVRNKRRVGSSSVVKHYNIKFKY